MIPAWVGDYIGLPFLARGRGENGSYDCWGLLRHVLAEQRGINLPSLADRYDSTLVKNAAQMAQVIAHESARAWLPVTAGHEETFDVIEMRINGHPMHVGLVVARGLMLHIEDGCESVIENYHSAKWRHRVTGFWRYGTKG